MKFYNQALILACRRIICVERRQKCQVLRLESASNSGLVRLRRSDTPSKHETDLELQDVPFLLRDLRLG
ncbi:hypothetical protein E2C01_011980 [Portunus trituberculatus]|uniref:Uncharacterized protein n=1 Tax=Portunus trituberculatus TaxID=210409 RepID=A0A5B7DCT0_PORTR|nr:hypothetical protein [Portunus trituberculatus]